MHSNELDSIRFRSVLILVGSVNRSGPKPKILGGKDQAGEGEKSQGTGYEALYIIKNTTALSKRRPVLYTVFPDINAAAFINLEPR